MSLNFNDRSPSFKDFPLAELEDSALSLSIMAVSSQTQEVTEELQSKKTGTHREKNACLKYISSSPGVPNSNLRSFIGLALLALPLNLMKKNFN